MQILSNITAKQDRKKRDRFRYVMSNYNFAEGDEIESQFNVETLIEMLTDKTCANSIWQNN